MVGEGEAVNRLSEVLLVDDNPLQLRVREAVLHKAGFRVYVATTADSALAMLHSLADRIGVVVTDHVMPERSGSERCAPSAGRITGFPSSCSAGCPRHSANTKASMWSFARSRFPRQN